MIIGLLGYGEVGKSETARILDEMLDYTRISFTDPITMILLAVNPIVKVEVDDIDKLFFDFSKEVKLSAMEKMVNCLIGRKYITSFDEEICYFYYFADLYHILGYTVFKRIKMVREYYQKQGSEGGRDIFGQDVWVKAMQSVYNLSDGDYVFENIRFRNEAQCVIDNKGLLVKVTRKGFDKPVNSHKSDTGIPFDLAEYEIKNDSDIIDLKHTLVKFVNNPENFRVEENSAKI